MVIVLFCKWSDEKTKKKRLQGTNVEAVSTTTLTTSVIATWIGLATELVFMSTTYVIRGSRAVVSGKVPHKARDQYGLQ